MNRVLAAIRRPGEETVGALFLAAMLIAAALASLAAGRPLFEAEALRSIAYQLPEFGLLTIAMALPMLSGGINLAVVAQANLCAIAAAAILAGSDGGAAALGAAALAALAVGLAGGAANGLAVARFRIAPVLATLCAMLVMTGLGILWTGGAAVTDMPDIVRTLANAEFLGVPAVLFVFLVAAAALALLLANFPFGPELRATGLNEAAARFSGIDTRRIVLDVYLLSGVFSALAGLVMLARFNSAKAGYGDSYLLATILAAVLGGVSPDGGRGSILGLVAAVVVLQATASALNLSGVNPYLTPVAWGAILVAKLALGRRAQT